MDERIKELVESTEEIEHVEGGGKGAWDIEGLKEALKAMFPSKPGARRILLDKVMKFHSTGDIKHKAHYAKQKLAQAAEELGWEVIAISSRKIGGKEYIEIEVDF